MRVALIVFLLAGCGDDGRPPSPTDGGRDAATVDAAGRDAAGSDSATMTGTQGVGDPCTMDSDCAQPPRGECFREGVGPVSFPNGFCSRACTDDDSDCGPEGVCASIGSSGGGSGIMGQLCTTMCSSDAECRMSEGYRCQMLLGFGFCVPPGL